MSQPAQTVQKQQMQKFDLLGWVFQRCYSLLSSNFFVNFQFLSPGNEVRFCWRFVGPNVLQFSLLLQNRYALWVSLWTIVFLSPQNSCFSLSGVGLGIFFALTGITYASISDIKSMKSIADTPLLFPNVFWHSFLLITGVELARKTETFNFPWKKFSSWKRNCCKIIPQYCWMDDSEFWKDYECKTMEFYICPKKRQFPGLLVGKKLHFFSKVGFSNSTCRFLKFTIILSD